MKLLKRHVPRAIFYMNLKTPVRSLLEILFNKKWKSDQKGVQEFKNSLALKFNFTEPLLSSHARIVFYHILKYLNFPKDSEIIISPISLAEMLKMIRLNHLNVKFVGYKENSFSLDLDNLRVSKKTKAFLYTPIAGIHTDMDALRHFCKTHNLTLIQDLTQSLGGRWNGQDLHSYADYNFYSLCDLKTLHTHRGGLAVSRDSGFRRYFEQIQASWFIPPTTSYFINMILEDMLSVILLNRSFFNFFGIWILRALNKIDIRLIENLTAGYGYQTKFFHLFSKFMASGNDWSSDDIPSEQKYTYTGLQARIGLERLKKFDLIESERKRKILLFYANLQLNKKLTRPKIPEDAGHVFWRAPLIVEDFLDFQSYLLTKKIDIARSNLPWLPELVRDNNSVTGEQMKKNCAYIPIYHYLTDEEVLLISQAVNQYESDKYYLQNK